MQKWIDIMTGWSKKSFKNELKGFHRSNKEKMGSTNRQMLNLSQMVYNYGIG